MDKVGLGIIKKKVDITVEQLQKMFPAKKNTITAKTVELLNEASEDPEFDGYRLIRQMENLQSVMYKNSSSMEEYLDALRFCAYLETCDDSYTEAYKKTFARRDFVRDRRELPSGDSRYSELTSAASRFRRSPLVIDILTQADVPLYLLFQGFRYKAVMRLAHEMENARFDKDRINAADKLLTHVKPPDNVKIELEVGKKESQVLQDLNDQLAEIASRQLHHLKMGSADLSQLGAMKPRAEIIDVETEG